MQQGGEDIWCGDPDCNWEEGDPAAYEETYGDGSGAPCPYCKKDHRYTGDGMDDYESTEVTCEHCDKTFTLQCRVSVNYMGYPQ